MSRDTISNGLIPDDFDRRVHRSLGTFRPPREERAAPEPLRPRRALVMPPVVANIKHKAEVFIRGFQESGAGIAALELPPPRVPWVCPVDDWDLLPDVRQPDRYRGGPR